MQPTDPRLLAALALQMPDAVIFADREGIVRFWNRGAEAVFGFTADEVVGQSLDVIVPERLRAAHWAAYGRAMEAGRTRLGNAHDAVAANTADVRRSAMPLTRPRVALGLLAIVGAIVWMGWQFSAPRAAADRPRASTAAKPVRMNATPAPAEPAVFATRVLRSEPRSPAPPPKAPAETAAAPAPPTQTAPRTEP